MIGGKFSGNSHDGEPQTTGWTNQISLAFTSTFYFPSQVGAHHRTAFETMTLLQWLRRAARQGVQDGSERRRLEALKMKSSPSERASRCHGAQDLW